MSKENWKRGPEPLTAKRDLYVRLMSQGMQSSEACRQVGVNRKTGQRWRLGRVVNDVKHGEYRYDPIVAPAGLRGIVPAGTRSPSEMDRVRVDTMIGR